MTTIKQIYDAYPGHDLLPIKVTDATTLQDVTDVEDQLGDTLFVFLCRELCDDHALGGSDGLDAVAAARCLSRVVHAVVSVRAAISPDGCHGPHLATIMASQSHGIINMAVGESSTVGLCGERLQISRMHNGTFYVGASRLAVGNEYGALQAYMLFALTAANLIPRVNDV